MPGQISVGPNGHLLLDGEPIDATDPRFWGTAGQVLAGSTDGIDLLSHDPRYIVAVDGGGTNQDGSSGSTQAYALRPEVAERLKGRVQLLQSGTGGFLEVIDPSLVEYDEEFGLLTPPSNIRRQDDAQSQRMDTAAMIMVAGAFGGAALASGGAAAGGAAAEGAGGLTLAAEGTAGVGASATGSGTIAGLGAAGGTGAAAAGTPTAGTPAVQVPSNITTAPSTYTGSPALVDTPAIIGQSNPNLLTQGWDWYNGLSPGARAIVNGAASGGAQALLGANAQRNAQEFVNQQAEQQREDRVRRGSMPAFGSAFTPRTSGSGVARPTGILDSRRRGG